MEFKNGKWLIECIHRLQSNPNETSTLEWKPILTVFGEQAIASKLLHDDIFRYTSSTSVSTILPGDDEHVEQADAGTAEDMVIQFTYEAANKPFEVVKAKYIASDAFTSDAENYNLQLFFRSIANCQILDAKELDTSEVAVIAEFTCQGISSFLLYGGKITLKLICCNDDGWKISRMSCPAQVAKVEYDPIGFIYP